MAFDSSNTSVSSGQLTFDSSELRIQTETSLIIPGYETDSDETAHLCCSECGERVVNVPDRRGAICGCETIPERWELEDLDP